MLSNTERIIFLGFGFHIDNVRRFRFFCNEKLKGLEVFTTNFGFTAYEYEQTMESLAQYGLSKRLLPYHGQPCD